MAAALAASACSLVVGTSEYTLADASVYDSSAKDAQGADDVATPDAAADVEPSDAGPCAPSVGCIATAGVCGSNCGVTYTSCMSGCKNNPGCQSNCASANTSCRSSCAAQCFQCTVDAGCPAQGACNDAAAQ